MDYSYEPNKELLNRMCIIRRADGILCRLEPSPCDKGVHEGLTITKPGVDSTLTDEQLKNEFLRFLLTYADTDHLAPTKEHEDSTPTRTGERLLLFILTREEHVHITGDLKEEYAELATERGETYAKVWYWRQVVGSAWPLICMTVRREFISRVEKWFRRLV